MLSMFMAQTGRKMNYSYSQSNNFLTDETAHYQTFVEYTNSDGTNKWCHKVIELSQLYRQGDVTIFKAHPRCCYNQSESPISTVEVVTNVKYTIV